MMVEMMMVVMLCMPLAMIVGEVLERLLLRSDFAIEACIGVETLHQSSAKITSFFTEDVCNVSSEPSHADISGWNGSFFVRSCSLPSVEVDHFFFIVVILGQIDELILSGWIWCDASWRHCWGRAAARISLLATRCSLGDDKFDTLILHFWR